MKEIINSCSHDAVADAAVQSLGFEFYSRMKLLAGAHQKSAGAYAAHLVRQFAADADEHAWTQLALAVERRDMPVLAGLNFILDMMLQTGANIGGVRHSASHNRRQQTRVTFEPRSALDDARVSYFPRRNQGRVPAGASGARPGW